MDLTALDIQVLAVAFAAAFMQGLVGFGSAMVAMAVLPGLIGLGVATPLVAVSVLPSDTIILLRYRRHLSLRAVSGLIVGMLAGIPIGLFALRHFPAKVLLPALGVVIAAYALLALVEWRPPELPNPRWGLLFGSLSGVLGGAYNVSGPPVVIYGNCRRWLPPEFKGNLQLFFLIGDLLVSLSHGVAGNLTPAVWDRLVLVLPVSVLGVLAGMLLDRFIHPALFRRLVLVALVVLGLRLVVA